MDDRAVDKIFLGCLESLPPVSSKIVRIFTSSTFTDMSMERNALMEDVYPRIKDFCRERHGLEFQVVDMRWGVRDEATDDHMTTDLCMREIENCQRLSMGPNFVVFLGQKYGYRPIPTIIDGQELRMIRETLVLMSLDVSLLDRWYREDTNAVPSVFVLQPISSILINFNNKRAPKLQAMDQATWWEVLEKLQKMLRKAAQTLYMSKRMDQDAMHNYMMSVTEREVINGILNVSNTRNHCLAYIRHINSIDMTNLKQVCKFIDVIGRTVDIEAQRLLTSLRDERLPAKIEVSNIVKYTIEWTGKEGLDTYHHHDYLRDFTAHFYKYITRLVDRAMRKEDLSSQGHIVTEILQHLHAANNAVRIFQGREVELNRIQSYIKSNCEQPLVLHGRGGCGKTSLLAKAASMVACWSPQGTKPILVLRFLGTTPDSSGVVPMLSSVCQQIMYNYLLPWDGIPDDLIPLIAYLKRLLVRITSEQPLFIFLDSVDQLTGPNESNKLSWLPTRLPPNVKIVVSTVSEGDCREYHLLQKMLANSNQFIEVHPLGEELAEFTIRSWLKLEKRDLTNYQWKVVRSVINKCTLPIFIKLVFADVIRWKSYSKAMETTLAYTVMDSIMKLFDRIEMQHGKVLVAHALSYITAAKSGLSETELEDLISLDDIVLDDVYQYHMPPVRRIPPLLWTRIRRDLPNYLSERDADGVSVLNWYHRQFREAAIERYFKKPESIKYFHSSIAEYFLGTWGGGRPKPFKYTEIQRHRFGLTDKEGSADRKVPLQPLVFYASDGKVSRYNRRKFGELPFHLVRSERFDDLFEHVLFNYPWLHSKISSCPLQAVLADFEDAVDHLTDSEMIKELHVVADALRLGGVVLSQYPNMLASQISGRLLPVKGMYKRVAGLIQQCDELGPKHCALIPAFHSLHTPGGPLKYSLEGHSFAVFGFVLTSDLRFVLSVSNRFLMFDLATGEVTRDMNPEIFGIMQTLVISADDKYAATYTNYDEILILNALSGDVDKLKDQFKCGPITGITITETVVIAWTQKEWIIFDVSNGKKLKTNDLDVENYSIILIHYIDEENYSLGFSTSGNKNDGEESDQVLQTVSNGVQFKNIDLKGGLLFVPQQKLMYISERCGEEFLVVCYTQHTDEWSRGTVLGKVQFPILALETTPCLKFLIAIFAKEFILWNLDSQDQLTLLLPNNVRNISTKPLQSQSSLVLTKYNQYAIGGIRKFLYVWNMKDGLLLKEVDAHFGRIIRLKPLIVDDFNGVVSSSIDRTVKVWNIQNIFEKVHVIDRMEMAIDSLSMSSDDELAITVTRSSVGVWSIRAGKLWGKLVDSPVGAIITHAVITANGRYVVIAESGSILFWSLREGTVVAREKHPNVKQLLMGASDSMVIIIAVLNDKEAVCTARKIPTAEAIYTFNFAFVMMKSVVVTGDKEYLVLVSSDMGRECLLIHNCSSGELIQRIYLKIVNIMGFSGVVSFPGKTSMVALVGSDTTYIVDIEEKKIVRGIKRWNGYCTADGKYGLVAPTRGGLEVIELRHGKTVKVLIPPISEGVFSVMAKFSRSDDYVLYYHSGRRTVRLFRVSDGKMIGNYRLSAEASDITTTHDGLSVVVGGVDGSFVVLAIVDSDDPSTKVRLQQMPSRSDEHVKALPTSLTFKTVAKVTKNAVFTKRASGDTEETQTSKACVIS